MKKAFIFSVIFVVIIILTLTMMPLAISADQEWKSETVSFITPDYPHTSNWTNPNGIGISFVVTSWYAIHDPSIIIGPFLFSQDGTQYIVPTESITVTGIGTPDISVFVNAYASTNFWMEVIEYRWGETPRTDEMMCQRVWINEDGHFQFSFINLYADNNWVRIYSMNPGEMVFEADMPTHNGNLIVDLPDGMYTVKTFHDQPEPIQEFVIGKPADMGYEGADNEVNHEVAPADNAESLNSM